MTLEPAALGDWPIAAWVILILLTAFLGRYSLLRWHWKKSRPAALAAEQSLVEAASRLREFAAEHQGRLPQAMEEVGGDPAWLTYRPVPSLTLDERLILVHDAASTHKLLEFPSLQDGRGAVLCSGRLLVLTEAAFDKLVAADDMLRGRLGLGPIGGAKS